MTVRKSDLTIGAVASASLPVVTAFGGIAYGSHLSGIAAKDATTFAKFEEQQASAYVDYINAERVALRGPNDAPETAREQAAIRIGIYGDAAVVHSIADYWRAGGLTAPCPKQSDVRMAQYENMRRAVFQSAISAQTRADLAVIILGCKIST